MIPIRGFVHEVLRRSRTSTSVLQTALCYLEAVRVKVPELLQQEKAKIDHPEDYFEVEHEPRIIKDDERLYADSMGDAGRSSAQDYVEDIRLDGCHAACPLTAPPTELLTSIDAPDHSAPRATSASTKQPSPPLPPLPPMPSPLLCPRRTFLACLILASKFLQDRSYSNKAWAKLAGLPPREIGRCERAVGEALEWRLWVGKTPTTTTPPVGTHRAVARCRSESTLQLPSCAFPTATAPAAYHAPRVAAAQPQAYSSSAGLRRSSTMPDLGQEDYSTSFGTVTHSSYDAWTSASSLASASFPYDTEMAFSPTMYNGPQLGPSDSLPPSQMGSIFAYVPSPPLSTPTLSYSPMSTASSASSDDGERTVQFTSFVDVPEYRAGVSSGRNTGRLPSLPFVFDRSGSHTHVKLAAIEPAFNHGAVRLPPLAEAVSHPSLFERSIQPIPAFGDVGVGAGDSVSVYNSYYANWSVSG